MLPNPPESTVDTSFIIVFCSEVCIIFIKKLTNSGDKRNRYYLLSNKCN